MLRNHHIGSSAQAGFPQHLTRNQVFGFRDTLPLSAISGGGPRLNVHAAHWTSRVGVSAVSQKFKILKLNLQLNIEDSSKTFLQSSVFDSKLKFKFETF